MLKVQSLDTVWFFTLVDRKGKAETSRKITEA